MKYLFAVLIVALAVSSNVYGQYRIGDAGLEKDFAKD